MIEKQADGFRFTQVEVRAEVALKRQELTDEICELGNLAEKQCLISRPVTCSVHYDLEVKTGCE